LRPQGNQLTFLSPVLSKSADHRRRITLAASVALHLGLLAWLVHTPPAEFIAPTFLRQGREGTSSSPIYYEGSPEVARTHLPLTRHLILKAKNHKSLPTPEPDQTILSNSKRDEATLLASEIPAGNPYGSLSYGTLNGPDVRPALPVFFPDPIVDISEVPGGQGDVVVEITIDDQGNVVQESLVRGLSQSIDQRVMASILRWQFRPATKNSVPIASKQDVYYHFPR
jgi:TonB family protein